MDQTDVRKIKELSKICLLSCMIKEFMEIVIKNLSKNYGRKAAIKNVSVTIHSGMYGLLGRNGAGKTSLMRILATLLVPSGGEVSMNGIPINETGKIREIVGYLSQNFSFYRNMSVYDAMDYLGLLSNLPDKIRKERIASLLEQVNLKENMRTKIKALSGGMRQRLGIAQALLHDPQILIVDEPTAGLDPEERIRFLNMLSEFAEDRIVIKFLGENPGACPWDEAKKYFSKSLMSISSEYTL